ncbi:MAG: hypothetical protein ACLP9S_00735 [Syntrophales bacterium]|jgi:hypothetical protein
MKTKMQIDLQASTPSEGQRILLNILEKLKSEGLIAEYHFEIDTPDGAITEICVLENEKVIA